MGCSQIGFKPILNFQFKDVLQSLKQHRSMQYSKSKKLFCIIRLIFYPTEMNDPVEMTFSLIARKAVLFSIEVSSGIKLIV